MDCPMLADKIRGEFVVDAEEKVTAGFSDTKVLPSKAASLL